MDPQELIQRGERIYHTVYEGALKEQLEKTARGRFLILNVDTGEYLLAGTRADALRQFRAKFPKAPSYIVRIGLPSVIA